MCKTLFKLNFLLSTLAQIIVISTTNYFVKLFLQISQIMIDDVVKFWTKHSISNQKVGFKGSTFKGSEVGRLVVLSLWNQWLRKKARSA